MRVLIEVEDKRGAALLRFLEHLNDPVKRLNDARSLVKDIPGAQPWPTVPPIPIFEPGLIGFHPEPGKRALPKDALTYPSVRSAVACDLDLESVPAPSEGPALAIYPDPEMGMALRPGSLRTVQRTLRTFRPEGLEELDCTARDVMDPVSRIRSQLGVLAAWSQNNTGHGTVVGVIDTGIFIGSNSRAGYPVKSFVALPDAPAQNEITLSSHGSLVAAGITVAAPECQLIDYVLPGGDIKASDVTTLCTAVLAQRALNGEPHLVVHCSAFFDIPRPENAPQHPAYDPNHPLNVYIAYLVQSGCPVVMPSGNCGPGCPYSECRSVILEAAKPIVGPNSLAGVITAAAVNGRYIRPEYSSTGPGFFFNDKPDVSGYTQFSGTWGFNLPNRSANLKGTSAAAALVTGVATLLLNKHPGLDPAVLKQALIAGATPIKQPGFNFKTGHGVVNVAASLPHV